jgi:hypothetical protein
MAAAGQGASPSEPLRLPEGKELEALMAQAAAWLRDERALHRPAARPLRKQERARFEPFFPRQILDAVRVLRVPGFQNPPFLTALGTGGPFIPLDLRTAAGLAVIDTVLVAHHVATPDTEPWYSLLFHELVHVLQYHHLGTEAFVRTYAEGLIATGLHYPTIPHEAQAFALQGRFQREPEVPFSVLEEVGKDFPAEPR